VTARAGVGIVALGSDKLGRLLPYSAAARPPAFRSGITGFGFLAAPFWVARFRAGLGTAVFAAPRNWPSRQTKTRNSRAQRPDGRKGGSAGDVQYGAGSVEILFLQRLDRLGSGKNDQFHFAMLSIAFQLVCHR